MSGGNKSALRKGGKMGNTIMKSKYDWKKPEKLTANIIDGFHTEKKTGIGYMEEIEKFLRKHNRIKIQEKMFDNRI